MRSLPGPNRLHRAGGLASSVLACSSPRSGDETCSIRPRSHYNRSLYQCHPTIFFPALATSRIDQVSVECAGAKAPLDLLGLLKGKEVLLGVINVASDRVETPEEVAATIEQASRFVPVERLYPCTNCGMAPMERSLAVGKLVALGAGAALARSRFESTRR